LTNLLSPVEPRALDSPCSPPEANEHEQRDVAMAPWPYRWAKSLVLFLLGFAFDVTVAVRFIWLAFWGTPGSTVVRPLAQAVEDAGYQIETHTVLTRDGYRLSLFRVLANENKASVRSAAEKSGASPAAEEDTEGAEKDGKEEEKEWEKIGGRSKRKAVLLWHGLLDDAYTWVEQGKDRSLAYMLADQGYDVWMGNNRGNCYCQEHTYLSVKSEEFWNFSWDEMAKYDVQDTIKYIQAKKTPPNEAPAKIAYIGHSEGTTQMFAGLSENPQFFEQSLSCFVALGPVARVGSINSRALKALALFRVDYLCWVFGLRKSFMPRGSMLEQQFLGIFSFMFPSVVEVILTLLCGKPNTPMATNDIINWGQHEPGGSSVVNIAHWCQMIRSDRFQKCDYGSKRNMMRYGTKQAPAYDLSRVPRGLNKLLIRGTNDALVGQKDFAWLCEQVGVEDAVELEGWNHTDYLWDPNAHVSLYPRVIKFVNNVGA